MKSHFQGVGKSWRGHHPSAPGTRVERMQTPESWAEGAAEELAFAKGTQPLPTAHRPVPTAHCRLLPSGEEVASQRPLTLICPQAPHRAYLAKPNQNPREDRLSTL